jgi:hypothetical protein
MMSHDDFGFRISDFRFQNPKSEIINLESYIIRNPKSEIRNPTVARQSEFSVSNFAYSKTILYL